MTGMIAGRETACTQTADKSSICKNTFRKKKSEGVFVCKCLESGRPPAEQIRESKFYLKIYIKAPAIRTKEKGRSNEQPCFIFY